MTHNSSPSVSFKDGFSLFVGIDVAKHKLDLARSDSGELLVFSNDRKGIDQIVRLLTAAGSVCIVIESTGGLERDLLDALLDAGLPVALVNPSRVRHFAIGIGILAKTDSIDATVLMKFAQLARFRLAQKHTENQTELDGLITCRRQLIATRTAQGNVRLTTGSKVALKAIDSVLKTLEKQIESIERSIRKLIDSDDDFRHLDRQMRSVPGVGPVLSSTLVAELPELGDTDRQHLGALVGVAPFNHDSGRFQGKRSIRGGRTDVRGVLYMATLAGIRCNPVLKRFAERLARAGKAPKVIIVACMRKLLSLINAMVRDNLMWHELQVVKLLTV